MKIFSKIKSKEGKVLATNFAYLSVLKIAGYLFPLITLPYLARVIGLEKFGELAFATSVIIFFETFVDYGFNYTATRDVSKNRDNIEKISEIVSTVMFTRLLLMAVGLVILLILILIIPFFNQNSTVLLLTSTYVLGYTFFPEWVFQAFEQMKYITILNVLSKLIFTVLVFIIIREESDYLFHPLLIGAGFLISGIISLYILSKKFGIKFIVPSFKTIINALNDSGNMFLSLLLPNLYTNFSIVFLTRHYGESATGLYSSGNRFIGLFEQLMNVLSRTFYPFLARRIEKHDFFRKISFFFSLITSIFLFFTSDLLVWLFYTSEFEEASSVIKIMSISPFFLFLINTYGTNYLVLKGEEKLLKNIIFVCSILGLLLAVSLIYLYGIYGIASAITIVWGVRGFFTWFYANKVKKRNNE